MPISLCPFRPFGCWAWQLPCFNFFKLGYVIQPASRITPGRAGGLTQPVSDIDSPQTNREKDCSRHPPPPPAPSTSPVLVPARRSLVSPPIRGGRFFCCLGATLNHVRWCLCAARAVARARGGGSRRVLQRAHEGDGGLHHQSQRGESVGREPTTCDTQSTKGRKSPSPRRRDPFRSRETTRKMRSSCEERSCLISPGCGR